MSYDKRRLLADFLFEKLGFDRKLVISSLVSVPSDADLADLIICEDEYAYFDWKNYGDLSDESECIGGIVMPVFEYLDVLDYFEEYLGEGESLLSKAFAICYSVFAKKGYFKKGTYELTRAGKRADKKHASEPEHKDKLAQYEVILAKHRKGPRREGDRDRKMPAFMVHCVVKVYNKLANQ